MSILKLAKEVEEVTPNKPTRMADYLIPSVQRGATLGTGIGVGSSLLNSKPKSLGNAVKSGLAGGVVGSGAGLLMTPISNQVGALNKSIGRKVTNDRTAESETKNHAVGSGLIGSALGGAVGGRLAGLNNATAKSVAKGIGAGALAGGSVGASVGYNFENSAQKGKRRRDNKEKRREEYKNLQEQLKTVHNSD